MSTNNGILPNLRPVKLPNDAKALLSSALRLLLDRPNEFRSTAAVFCEMYSEQAAYERLLPKKKADWDEREKELKTAPSAAELSGYRAIKDKGYGGRARWRSRSWNVQGFRNKREWMRQHKAAAQHPNYLPLMAQRFAELRAVKVERKRWRPSRTERLTLAMQELLAEECPAPTKALQEYARRVIVVAALLFWPDPLLMLGDVGKWSWESEGNLATAWLDGEEWSPGRRTVAFGVFDDWEPWGWIWDERTTLTEKVGRYWVLESPQHRRRCA